jgi:hypothetical protein
MPDTYKTTNQTLGTSNTTIYASPSNANTIVIFGQLANIDGTNSADAWIYATDSASGNTRALGAKIPVPASAATTFLTGKLVLRPNDSITARASATNSIDITVSVLEVT